jgi:uncharacterized RDD family membrane protein YckC/Tfp pilus assembly major pilin PilA
MNHSQEPSSFSGSVSGSGNQPHPFATQPPPNPFASPETQTVDVTHSPVEFAGFGARVAAFIIDRIVIAFIASILSAAVAAGFGLKAEEYAVAIGVGVFYLSWIPGLIYYTLTEGSRAQASLGKRLIGIRVATDRGGRVGYLLAFWRNFAGFFSSLILMIGYLMAAFTGKRQALHDLLAGCVVVTKDSPIGATPQVGKGGGASAGVVVAVLAVVGFIIIAIVGVLAAIAIPAYQDYTLRAKVNEAHFATAKTRETYSNYLAEHGAPPKSLSEISDLPKVESQSVESVALDDEGRLVVALKGHQQLEGKSLFYTPDNEQLVCSTDLKRNLAPISCRY